MERKVAFKALVGSHNYNLNTPESDKDYKVFTLPTFEDLYFNRRISTSKVGETEDYDFHDVRQIPELWWKTNINFVEVLYSTKTFNTIPELLIIFNMKDRLVRMNLPYFYTACKGMHFNKLSQIDKGTSGTQHLVDKYGYDTKQALHAYRVLDFITRFYFTDFEGFKWAMTYEGKARDFMLSIKNGKYTKEEYLDLVKTKYEKFEVLEEVYKNQKPDIEVKEILEGLIMEMVKKNLE
jgi:uncharacterized protein